MSNQWQPTVEEFLRTFANQNREVAIIHVDVQGKIAWFSVGAEEIFGHAANDIIGQPITVLFTPEDNALGLGAHELETARINGTAEDDRWMARADGSKFWASGVLLALKDKQGHPLGYGKLLRSRTDLREQLVTLRNSYEAALEACHRRDNFISTLSHELRNPLAPLSNATQLIRMLTPNSPEVEYPLSVIERQIEALHRLVNDLLDKARIDSGKIQLQLEFVSVQMIIQRAVESTRPLFCEQRHTLHVLLPHSRMHISGDVTRLVQVFVNLLNNAAKYTPPGGEISVKSTIEGSEAVVHVEDNGIGIRPEMLPSIFELFTQVEDARERSQGGLGIGLALVKNLITLHGGSVQVTSDGQGKGSKFSVRLPLSQISTAN